MLEGDEWKATQAGTVQGGSISPLLANVYLHYVFDTWVKRWRRTQARGDVIVVRFADDFVVGFEHQAEAERFLTELKERFRKFGLELHSEKTRLIGRMHAGIPALGAYLRAVMAGHMQYYAVPFNLAAVKEFRQGLVLLWRQSLSRRSQTARVTWERMTLLEKRWIPPARICHPYPDQRVRVMTQGRSRMR